MKSFWSSVVLITYVALVGCGGGSGGTKSPAGSGGSSGGSTTAGAGGSDAGGSAGGGIAGGGTDAGQSKADARLANPDQASSKDDAAGSANACQDFTPCGGNLVGTWHLSSECARYVDSSYCQGRAISMDMSGSLLTYTFNANGSFAVSFSGSIEETIRYPITCFSSDAGAAQTCSDLEQGVRQAMQAGADAGALTINLTSFTCALDTEQSCVCDEKATPSAISVTGTYTTSGGQFTTTVLNESPMPDGGIGDAGTGAPTDYCVVGNTLRLRSTSSSSSGSDTISTLTK
jgi:hypothetical protein